MREEWEEICDVGLGERLDMAKIRKWTGNGGGGQDRTGQVVGRRPTMTYDVMEGDTEKQAGIELLPTGASLPIFGRRLAICNFLSIGISFGFFSKALVC